MTSPEVFPFPVRTRFTACPDPDAQPEPDRPDWPWLFGVQQRFKETEARLTALRGEEAA